MHCFTNFLNNIFCLQRRGGSENSNSDSIVNQFLTLIDGFKGINNIFVIGTTNRLELIDPALLRSGRLELKLGISLPDEDGRAQIITVHTKSIMEKGMLDVPDDFTKQIAKKTKGWSGADLASMVGSAFSHALYTQAGSLGLGDLGGIKITLNDFNEAINRCNPKADEGIRYELEREIMNVPDFKDIYEFSSRIFSGNIPYLTCILIGPTRSGKSTLATKIARDCYHMESAVKWISSSDTVRLSDDEICQRIQEIFASARAFTKSIIVLDDLEGIILCNAMTKEVSTKIVIALKSELKKNIPKGHTLSVLATMNSQMENVTGVEECFNYKLNMPMVLLDYGLKILETEGIIPQNHELPSSYGARKVTIGLLFTLVDWARSEGSFKKFLCDKLFFNTTMY